MTKLAYASATELARLIQDGSTTAAAVLEALLERHDRYHSDLNAIVVDDRVRARKRAAEADSALARGELWGALHGVPMTVKETYELEGLPTTGGMPNLADHVSASTAPAVQRLLDAGAVIYGKTNTPAYAADLQTYNSIYGTTNNPWDLARGPGGSSGGAAAALAAGLTPLELGSDIGGSIRIPAAFCGVCGHKPSYGLIPGRGHVPGPPGTLSKRDIGVMGPMARRVEDLELALGLLAGADDDEGLAWELRLPPARHSRLKDFRVAAWTDDPACPVDRAITERLAWLIDELRQAGTAVDATARPEGVDLAATHELYYQLLSGAMGAGLPEHAFTRLQETAAQPDASSHYAGRFARGATQSHAEWLRNNERRMQLRARWKRFFDRFDILLCPVVHSLPFPHQQDQAMVDRTLTVNGQISPYMDLLCWVGLTGVVYLPSTAVPIGLTPDGLPLSVQIVAPYLEDRTGLAFAREVERIAGGFQRPPGYGETLAGE